MPFFPCVSVIFFGLSESTDVTNLTLPQGRRHQVKPGLTVSFWLTVNIDLRSVKLFLESVIYLDWKWIY